MDKTLGQCCSVENALIIVIPKPILSARNLLLPAKQKIPRTILPRFGMTIWIKGSYCTTTVFPETLTADGRFVRLPAQVTGAAANLQARGCLALPRTATLSCDGQRATRNNKCPSRHLSSCRPG